MDEIIRELKELRIKHNLSQIKIAQLLGFPETTYRRYENGLSNPTPIYRKKIQKLITGFKEISDYLDKRATNDEGLFKEVRAQQQVAAGLKVTK